MLAREDQRWIRCAHLFDFFLSSCFFSFLSVVSEQVSVNSESINSFLYSIWSSCLFLFSFQWRIVISQHQRRFQHRPLSPRRQQVLLNVPMLPIAIEHQHLDKEIVTSFLYHLVMESSLSLSLSVCLRFSWSSSTLILVFVCACCFIFFR